MNISLMQMRDGHLTMEALKMVHSTMVAWLIVFKLLAIAKQAVQTVVIVGKKRIALFNMGFLHMFGDRRIFFFFLVRGERGRGGGHLIYIYIDMWI
jgi:hypothetical protein